MGIQTLYGEAQAYSQWNATLAEFLTEETGLNCTFVLIPLDNETAVYEATGNATVDLMYSNPGMHMCLEVPFSALNICCILIHDVCPVFVAVQHDH